MLYSLQYLRFVAASLVALTHSYESVPRYGRMDFGAEFNIGQIGVDIFFVISGFIMCYVTERREQSPTEFLSHRVARVVPPYWIVTALNLIVLILLPNVFHNSRFDPYHVVASFLFVAWPHPVKDDALPLYTAGWTLNCEAFFYLLFAVSLKLNYANRAIICSAFITLVVMTGQLVYHAGEIGEFYSRPIMLEFIYGLILMNIRKKYKPPLLIAVLFIFLGVFGFVISYHLFPETYRLSDSRFIVWGLPAALLVSGFVFAESSIPRVDLFKAFGDASYAIYLTHMFTIGLVGLFWGRFSLKTHLSDLVFISICIVFSTAVGMLFHKYIERKTTKVTLRLLQIQRFVG